MSGPSTTGKTNPEDYNLGRGKLYFAAIDATTEKPISWRFLGNAPAFTITTDIETLEHFSSQEGLKTLDKEVTVSRKVTMNWTLDEWNDENLADLFSGGKSTPTNAAVAGFSEYQMVADGDITALRYYDVVNSSGVRAYDLDTGDLTVKTTNATPVTLALGTDYEEDLEFGRIFLLNSSAVQTAITNVEGLDITLAAKAGAVDINEVRVQTQTAITGAIKFISENAVDGFKREFQFHKVTVKADGELALIGDDWGEMPFTGSAESSVLADSTSPTFRIRSLASA